MNSITRGAGDLKKIILADSGSQFNKKEKDKD